MRVALLGLAVVSVVSLVGCAGPRPRLSFAVEQRILRETTLDDLPDGQAAPGDSVVRVARGASGGGGACSGALIGPRHVLTAAHCVMRVDGRKELTEVPIVAGDVHVELGGDALPWGRVGVHEIHGCGGSDLEHDVAVLVLSRPLPAELPRFPVGWDAPREAGVFEMAGFGTPHTPRTIPGTSWSVLSLTRHAHRGPVIEADAARIVVGVPGLHGDSGGPIVDAETGQVISVVSRLVDPDRVEIPGTIAGPRLSTCRAVIERALAR